MGERYIEDRMDAIERKLDTVLSILGADNSTMTIRDIAELANCSRESLYKNKRYLLPNFGRDHKHRYSRKEVMEWLAKGEETLRKEWRQVQ